MLRPSGLALTLACLLPSAAWADCQERIASIESHPAVLEERDAALSGGQDTTVPLQQKGESVREDGGETKHADGGPATPSESWFTNSNQDDTGTVLTHLDTAKAAQDAGNEAACLEAVEQAEAVLENG
jgi:hypothetical protein